MIYPGVGVVGIEDTFHTTVSWAQRLREVRIEATNFTKRRDLERFR